MKLLDRHIASTVAVSALMVLLVLLALFSFGALVAELDAVGKGSYSLGLAAQYVLLTLPRLAYQLLPLVALLGSIIGLGVLANSNELIAMRAAGVSLARIGWAVMQVGVLLMAAAFVMGEYVAPPAEQYAQNMRAEAINGRFALTKQNGLWARDGAHVIHVRDVVGEKELSGVTVYAFDQTQRLQTLTQARAGIFEGRDWLLRDVVRSHIAVTGVVTEHLAELRWQPLLTPDMINVVAVKPDALSITGLLDYISYLRDNGLNAERYRLALWDKVALPMTTGVMVFLAIPFVFGSLRTVSIGQRILMGVLMGIGFYLADQAFSYAGLVYRFNPALSAVLPTALFLVLAIVLLRRVR